MLFPFLAVAAAVVMVPSGAVAQPTPVALQFQVNSYEPGDQGRPDLCADANGAFVVAFLDDYPPSPIRDGQDGSGSTACLKRFDPDGSPGFELLANTYTTGDQLDMSVGCAPQGDFLVTWSDRPNADGGRTAFDARAFDENSFPKANPFLIGGSDFPGGMRSTAVCRNAQGQFVAVFRDLTDVLSGQRYDDTGATIGTEFQIVTTSSDVGQPDCCGGEAGFVVTWADYPSADVGAQRFSPAAVPLGTEFTVNTYATEMQISPQVACNDDGNFVVVWASGVSQGQDGSSWGVFGRAFDASGAPTGTEFQANTYTPNVQWRPDVAMDEAARFVVVWDGPQATTSYRAIFGQAFGANAARAGGEFRVDGSGQHPFSSDSTYPSIVMTSATGFVVAWENDEDEGSGSGVFARQFDFPVATTTTTLGAASCGDPVEPGASGLTASDALFILRAAVGSETCAACVCDVDSSSTVSATDALVTLKAAVGQAVELDCPAC